MFIHEVNRINKTYAFLYLTIGRSSRNTKNCINSKQGNKIGDEVNFGQDLPFIL